jgi:NAD+ synthase
LEISFSSLEFDSHPNKREIKAKNVYKPLNFNSRIFLKKQVKHYFCYTKVVLFESKNFKKMQKENVINHIVNWLKTYAEKNQIMGFVVGVSGGIDSAVTSTLCAKTGLNVVCIEMPIHQAESHVSRAQEHIKYLEKNYKNVSGVRVNLTPVFEALKNEINLEGKQGIVDMSLANTRARLRMSTLYYYAGLHGYLVAGTGNKVEDFGVGFYTKYGDGGVDLSPIADLLKSEVYELGKALNVPNSILEAAPSDGLFGDARTDEDQIGASYPELEWAMKMHDQGKKVSDFENREQEVFGIYMRYHNNNKHKMEPIPVCDIPLELK